MAKSQTSTALGTLSSATSGSAVNVSAVAAAAGTTVDRSDLVVLVVSTSVTTGATIVVQARNRQNNSMGDTATSYREVCRFVVTANGSKAYPLAAGDVFGHEPDDLRVSTATAQGGSWTDGTHVCSLLSHA